MSATHIEWDPGHKLWALKPGYIDMRHQKREAFPDGGDSKVIWGQALYNAEKFDVKPRNL